MEFWTGACAILAVFFTPKVPPIFLLFSSVNSDLFCSFLSFSFLFCCYFFRFLYMFNSLLFIVLPPFSSLLFTIILLNYDNIIYLFHFHSYYIVLFCPLPLPLPLPPPPSFSPLFFFALFIMGIGIPVWWELEVIVEGEKGGNRSGSVCEWRGRNKCGG